MRVKRGNVARVRRKSVLKIASGFRGSSNRLFRTANARVMKSMLHAYVGRKHKKRTFRQIWIGRIKAFANQKQISYSKFMMGLKKSNVGLNRKMLAQLIVLGDASAINL
jgi:large subunit ribosomal protein L20|mmetsp:Transcript_16624/g.42445  ORF Transcript_16624/g.42445 Transcript_16624/m.42445 type:complete len:109 (+) Transcript_16624:137-463(+)